MRHAPPCRRTRCAGRRRTPTTRRPQAKNTMPSCGLSQRSQPASKAPAASSEPSFRSKKTFCAPTCPLPSSPNAFAKGLPPCKPVSVPVRRRAAIIHLGRPLPDASCDLPGTPIAAGRRIAPYLVLLRVGFALPPRFARGAVRSYRTISPLPRRKDRGGIFSAALSVDAPSQERPPARLTGTLPCGDRTFLPAPKARRLPGRQALA